MDDNLGAVQLASIETEMRQSLSRLRDERHRAARAAGRARRPQAGPAAHPLRDVTRWACATTPAIARAPVSSAKCSRTIHPHGDTAVYDTLVRMAQDFNLRYPLDRSARATSARSTAIGAAAMRYTEARLLAIADELLAISTRTPSISSRTTTPARREPTVLPGTLAQPAAQRRGRHRRRHGDEHPAAQPRRALRRHHLPDRQPRRARSRT